MSKQGVALVAMLDKLMVEDVKLDATEDEMRSHCDKYACSCCPIIDRCSLYDIVALLQHP